MSGELAFCGQIVDVLAGVNVGADAPLVLQQRAGSYGMGFLVYAGIAMFVFLLMQSFQRFWKKKWMSKGLG